MYRCELCGAVFAVPHIRSWRESMPDGFSEPCRQVLCPRCLEPYFSKISAHRSSAAGRRRQARTLSQQNRACREKKENI